MELASSSIKTESESESSEEGKEALTTMQRGFRQGDSVVLAMTGIKKVGTIFTEFFKFLLKDYIFRRKTTLATAPSSTRVTRMEGMEGMEETEGTEGTLTLRTPLRSVG